ncbi:TonB-dependent receptor [Massilia arenosa]|uniref:TonB-dependent receptor n=1 Tax=Zemynaea arenosa TaxID=2561931 RepID=A0A4Y9SUW5_9BURK|nr:TonB-dependent receptor [Massilia arenosa]TFW28546.1 TonB-dependent receptor [Massilia arenosa]
MRKKTLPAVLACLFLSLAAGTGHAQTQKPLADFSLEQLSEIVVSSVSRQDTRLASAPASIYRITAAQIRRSGATTLAEALRLAPNLQVAQADARSYAITSRGFSSLLENKLLVLVDGRSIYSPLFSGVFWDAQDLPLEDIERIEVISGPGATIWGANAVNGVINIITKPAAETLGGLGALTAGDGERGALARYGARLGETGAWRLYAKYGARDDLAGAQGRLAPNGWQRRQAGFRADLEAAGAAWMLAGDAYTGALGYGLGDIAISGANLNARMTRKLADGSGLRLQAWLDHVERDQPGAAYEKLDTVDLEFQHDWRPSARHTLAWGGGYRYARDRVTNGTGLRFLPAEAPLRWANLFVQDELALAPDWRLTAGLKGEQTNYDGLEWLPSLRLAWQLNPDDLLWAAATRAIRSPSRIDRDLYVPTPGQAPERPWLVEGGPAFRSETAHVAELGYRGQLGPAIALSATAFAARYDDLRTLEPQPDRGAVFQNLGEGRTRGLEAWARWNPVPQWRVTASAVVQRIATSLKPGSRDASAGGSLATNDPSHYWTLRSLWDVSNALTLDLFFRHVGSLPRPAVPAYSELNARLGWTVRPGLELSVTGRNLLHAEHAEFGADTTRALAARQLLLNVLYRF